MFTRSVFSTISSEDSYQFLSYMISESGFPCLLKIKFFSLPDKNRSRNNSYLTAPKIKLNLKEKAT